MDSNCQLIGQGQVHLFSETTIDPWATSLTWVTTCIGTRGPWATWILDVSAPRCFGTTTIRHSIGRFGTKMFWHHDVSAPVVRCFGTYQNIALFFFISKIYWRKYKANLWYMQYTEEENIPGLLLLIDFEKAFDTVSKHFLSLTSATPFRNGYHYFAQILHLL